MPSYRPPSVCWKQADTGGCAMFKQRLVCESSGGHPGQRVLVQAAGQLLEVGSWMQQG